MSKVPLKQALQQHFATQTLTEEQLAGLQTAQQSLDQAVAPAPQHAATNDLQRKTVYAFAMLLLCAVSLVLFSHFQQDGKHSLLQSIAEEVAKNHLKARPLEVSTDDLKVAAGYFTELDFSPVQSRLFADGQKTLLGARYCSIQGVTAAQLRYQASNGHIVTLYETAYEPGVFSDLGAYTEGGLPVEVFAKGLLVKIWIEKGLMMASVQQPPAQHQAGRAR